jgi:DNA replication and repair protein RecF
VVRSQNWHTPCMIIDGISVQSFRSFDTYTCFFDPKVTYIVGKNTAGKTNIVEAIALLSTGKSFRGVLDKDLIQWQKEMARVKGKIKDDTIEIVLTTGMVASIKTPLKKYLVNGVSRRALDAVGIVQTVLFSPEDLDILSGSPGKRRDFLDSILSQIDRMYRKELSQYDKALRQRNKLLYMIHEGLASRDQLAYWNTLVIQSGKYISTLRARFLDFCGSVVVPQKKFVVFYDKSEISQERLDMYAVEEVSAKATLVGPHRDNFVVHLEKNSRFVNVAVYGSRGEQRLSILWLKLAALAFFVETTGQKPVLLLDDIFSELDEDHQRLVMDVVGEYQTVITSADPVVIQNLQKQHPGVLIHV